MRSSRALWYAGSIGVTALLIGFWQLVADHGNIPAVFLPGPDRAWDALISGISDGPIGKVTGATVERMVFGWGLASLFGIALGSLIGSSRRAREYLAPSLEIIRPVPVSAFMPVVMAFLGIGANMVLVVVAIGAVWPVLLATGMASRRSSRGCSTSARSCGSIGSRLCGSSLCPTPCPTFWLVRVWG